jgi:hypothetical protein
MSALETQVGGSHYKDMPIQPMEYSMANKLDPCQHTIIKYVTRFRQKGGIQDLEKARHTLDMLIEFERKAQGQKIASVSITGGIVTHTTLGDGTVIPANDNKPALLRDPCQEVQPGLIHCVHTPGDEHCEGCPRRV